MAGHRPLMVFRDTGRDRIAVQPQQGLVAAESVGFQTLEHLHYMQQRFKGVDEEGVGRMATGGGGGGIGLRTIAGHQHQQRVLAAESLRWQRVNSRHSLPSLSNSLIHQGPGLGGLLSDWDGGGLARHIGSMSSGRMDRNFDVDEPVRSRQQFVVNISSGGEFPRVNSREVYAGLRIRDAREDIRETDFLKSAVGRVPVNLLDEARVEMSRACPRSAAVTQQQPPLEPVGRSRGVRFGREENGHADLIARYGDRSSSRNLERAHAAIGPAFQLENIPRKRSREEEANLDRERLIRHRKLSGIDSSSPPPPVPLPSPPPLKVLLRKESIQPKAEYRLLKVDEDDHEDGQLTPPPPIISQEQESDVMVITTRTEAAPKMDGNSYPTRYENGISFPLVCESTSNSRPPSGASRLSTGVDNVSVVGDQFQSLGSSKEQSLPIRERLPSPIYEDNKRMLPRFERVGGVVESYSPLTSDLSDRRRKGTKRESQNPTSAFNSGGGHDSPHHKRQQHVEDSPRRDLRSPLNYSLHHKRHQYVEDSPRRDLRSPLNSSPYQKRQQHAEDSPRRDVRSPLNSRSVRLGGAALDRLLLERLSQEGIGRVEKDVKRKTGAVKDSRSVGEMTISVQNHGQRIVKVEEYRSRDTHSRASSKTDEDQRLSQRGGNLRGVSDKKGTVSAGRDRTGVTKRKEYEDRPPVAAQEKAGRSHSFKVGPTHPHHLQKSTSKDRSSPYSQHAKNFVNESTGKYEVEKHRHQSIFSRLAGLKSETTTSQQTTADTSLKNNNSYVSSVHDRPSLPLPSRKSPSLRLQTSSCVDVFGNDLDFHGFPISTRSNREAEFSPGTNSGPGRPPGKHADPCDRLDKDYLKIQIHDVPSREELASKQQLESAAGRFSHISRKVYSLLEKERGGFQKDLKLFEYSDQLHEEEVAFPLGNAEGTLSLHSSENGSAEFLDRLPGNASKPLPKVISTGHKKDQVLKNSFLNAGQAKSGDSFPPIEDLVPDDNTYHENSHGRTSSVPVEEMPAVSACRQGTPSLNLMGEGFGSPTYLEASDRASPQSDLRDKKPMIMGSADEVVSKSVQPAYTGCTPTSLSVPTFMQSPRAPWDPPELKQLTAKVMRSSSDLQINKDEGSLEVISRVHVDGETHNELLSAPLPSLALSVPKEVLLFGANLNAHIGERVELPPKSPDEVEQDVVDSSALSVVGDGLVSESAEMILDVPAIVRGSEKDVCLSVKIGDDQLVNPDDLAKAEENLLICHDGAEEILALAHHVPSTQVQSEELSSIPEHYMPPPTLQKASVAAQGRQLSSTQGTGAHTWHRGSSSSTTPAKNANKFRESIAFGGLAQSTGRSPSAQNTAYVRKGNSLVRAPGLASLQSANDVKALSTSGQIRPSARQLPAHFRNTFIANPAVLNKPFYSNSRKYVAPPANCDRTLKSSARPINPSKISHSSNELVVSSTPPLAKGLPQVSLQVSKFPAKSGAPLVSHQEQQTGALPCPELHVTDGSDDHLGEAGMCETVKDRSSSTQSLTSVAGNLGSRIFQNSVNRLYVRRKANQLVVAPTQPADFLPSENKISQASKTLLIPGNYFKRKTNQLVRSISGKGNAIQNVVQGLLGAGLAPDIPNVPGRGITLVPKKMKLGKVLRQKKDSPGRSSWVWTLSGAAVGNANDCSAKTLRTGPLLFPWKRQNSLRTPLRSQKVRPLPEGNKRSLLFLMSKRLRKVQPVQPVYTRSADGFSLHRSGVMSLGGGNLKWTKSLERRAKEASEEVTKAVAEVERRKREKKEAVVEAAAKAKEERRSARKAARGEGERIVWVGLVRYKMDAASKTLLRIPDKRGETGDTDTISPTGWAMTSPLLTPRRSIIGGTVYLRVGNGNQLVRDPKAASRALASEKVRWSLHNARSRGAKKQQYCQFFTKFGKCNKESGKCSYIHDPDKVAVCTKFLKGNCTDVQCLLTHKIIPERMPDCSFFLEGLCTNESCPYRHVNVNPKAPYCDGFLRGYCKDGDKCNKKHRYICSVYAETGECSDRSTCKFHHPKKKDKPSAPISGQQIGTKRKRRYFSTVEPQPIRQKSDEFSSEEHTIAIEGDDTPPNDASMEFISLGNIEYDEDQKGFLQSQPWIESPGVTSFIQKEAGAAEEIEKRIKPTFLLQMTSPAAAAR